MHGETTQTPLVSIIIRCRNQAGTLKEVLQALSLQECAFNWELIVVDNDSTDQTVQLARDFGARIVSIKREEYTHGRALNRGLAVARGELVLNLSAHSLPVGRFFLASAVIPFQDPQMAAVMCMEAGRSWLVQNWHKPEDVSWRGGRKPATPREMFFSVRKMTNSALILRRSVWEKIPFDEMLESTEDKHWGMQVLSEGYTIRRCGESVYVSLVMRDRKTIIKRRVRCALAQYRITGQAPLTKSECLRQTFQVVQTIIRTAAIDVWSEIVVNIGIAKVPRLARHAPVIGSRQENEQHR